MDFDAIKAFVHVCTFGKKHPPAYISFSLVFSIMGFVLCVFGAVFFGIGWIYAVLMAAFIILDCYIYFGLPRVQYAAQHKFKEAVNEYVFTDEEMHVTSVGKNYSENLVISYSVIEKVIETSRYMFIFQTRYMAHIVDKTTINRGTAEQIRDKLRPGLGKKYMMCKY